MTPEQKQTLRGITPMGLHINTGQPCECGAEHYHTSKELTYSDFMTYHHTCNNCGNEFSTYIEG